MRAGLKGDIEGSATGRSAGTPQGLYFRGGATAGLRPSSTRNNAVLYHDRANGRIGPGAAEAAAPKPQRQCHEPLVVILRTQFRRAHSYCPINNLNLPNIRWTWLRVFSLTLACACSHLWLASFSRCCPLMPVRLERKRRRANESCLSTRACTPPQRATTLLKSSS